MTAISRLACYCSHCHQALARLFWQEDGHGSGKWMGTCMNATCSHYGSTIAAVDKEELAALSHGGAAQHLRVL